MRGFPLTLALSPKGRGDSPVFSLTPQEKRWPFGFLPGPKGEKVAVRFSPSPLWGEGRGEGQNLNSPAPAPPLRDCHGKRCLPVAI